MARLILVRGIREERQNSIFFFFFLFSLSVIFLVAFLHHPTKYLGLAHPWMVVCWL